MDTAQALTAARKLVAWGQHLESTDPEESRRVLEIANAGMAAVNSWLHDREAHVIQAHQDAVAAMFVEANAVPEDAGATRS